MKGYDYLPHELRKLGLKKQEADIYLILLENGYSSISKIASKTSLSRPTIYRNLKVLLEKELIIKEKKGCRNYFLAGSPDNLLNILKIQKRKAEEQEREFLRIISLLQGKYHLQSNQNQIKHFQKTKDKKFLFENIANESCQKVQTILLSPEKKLQLELQKAYKKIRERVGESFIVKEILPANATPSKKTSFIKTKLVTKIPREKKNLIITEKKVFLFSKNEIIQIEEAKTVKHFEALFDLLWLE
jgi:sugar-specific transcriptional regulator TrmB